MRDTDGMSSSFDPPPPPSYASSGTDFAPAQGSNGKATASMVCGIVGIVVFGIILGPIAIILGVLARREIESTGQRGRGMATAGIVLGIIAVVFFFIFLSILLNND